MIQNLISIIIKSIKMTFEICGIYIFWILLHFISANLYSHYCANISFFGLLISAFQAPAPHCVALRWAITTGGNIINQMWIVLGTWICGKIFNNVFNK
jgi:hypothetical protein